MVATDLSLKTDPSAALLERHAVRRSGGVPTVSVLIGPPGAAGALWRRWAAAAGRPVVVASGSAFPLAEWLRRLAERIDLPAAALDCVARHAGRESEAFQSNWRTLTAADRERRWNTLPIHPDDAVLRRLAGLADARSDPPSQRSLPGYGNGLGDDLVPARTPADSSGGASGERASAAPSPLGSRTSAEIVSSALVDLGVPAAAAVVRLVPPEAVPATLWSVSSLEELAAVAAEAARWASAVPGMPIALALPSAVWKAYVASAADSRAKAILKEGAYEVPLLDSKAASCALVLAGASPQDAAAVGRIVGDGADPLLVEAAAELARALAPEAPADGARSAAERFLHRFLESIPETAGRFELNGCLDFRFGRKPAEVDLLCRGLKIAVELDGYHHFREAADYRRDRNKDWELQRRGFLVLRFLAEDVFPEIETIRDRILSAVAGEPPGARP